MSDNARHCLAFGLGHFFCGLLVCGLLVSGRLVSRLLVSVWFGLVCLVSGRLASRRLVSELLVSDFLTRSSRRELRSLVYVVTISNDSKVIVFSFNGYSNLIQ